MFTPSPKLWIYNIPEWSPEDIVNPVFISLLGLVGILSLAHNVAVSLSNGTGHIRLPAESPSNTKRTVFQHAILDKVCADKDDAHTEHFVDLEGFWKKVSFRLRLVLIQSLSHRTSTAS